MNILIVGAGPVGCTLANLFSKNKKNYIKILDKRNHIAGNCFDYFDKNGILVHKYGPHYFRSNDKSLIRYLSKFTSWIKGDYFVKAYDQGKLFQFPINLDTLEEVFNEKFDKKKAQSFYRSNTNNIKNPKNFEEYLINKVGAKLYDKFYKNYTIKQWGIDPKKLDMQIAKRIPIRLNRDRRYIKEKYQIMPKNGFTAMFKKMITKKNIDIKLKSKKIINIDCLHKLQKSFDLIFYTGPIDTFFNYRYGVLNWRSLSFKFKNFEVKYKQDVGQINYPNNYDYTRSVEYKHVTKQISKSTTLSYEYPLANGDPYYPVNTDKDKIKYQNYLHEARKYEKVNLYMCGRLAEYTYINTDQAIKRAIELYEKINR